MNSAGNQTENGKIGTTVKKILKDGNRDNFPSIHLEVVTVADNADGRSHKGCDVCRGGRVRNVRNPQTD